MGGLSERIAGPCAELGSLTTPTLDRWMLQSHDIVVESTPMLIGQMF